MYQNEIDQELIKSIIVEIIKKHGACDHVVCGSCPLSEICITTGKYVGGIGKGWNEQIHNLAVEFFLYNFGTKEDLLIEVF